MTPISIGSATGVYETASNCTITRHSLDHQVLADVSHALRSLIQSLDIEADEEFWQRVLGPVRRIAFAFCSTPLPFDRAAAAAGVDWEKLHHQVKLCKHTYPDSHATLLNLVQQLERLSAESVSPFTATLESLHTERGGMSVVLRNPRMNQAVAAYFEETAELRNARVVSARQLRDSHLCDMLIAIGPCGWFPDYVFTAPRAPHIHVVSFRWIRDPWKPGPVFLNGSSSADKSRRHAIGALPKMSDQIIPHNQTVFELRPMELLPPLLPFGKAGAHIPGCQSSAGEETLPARFCHLSGGRAVFVSADEGASSLVIDTSEADESIVRRVPVDELEPEMYLLLRTSGGGDFIAPIADRILGERAAERRSQQTMWKDRLITAAQNRFGSLSRRELSARIANNLRVYDLSEARSVNVHYWMSSKCIHPRKKEDFEAIMAFAGLADRTQELWDAMEEIDRAHKRAGQAIRQMLLQRIATSSLEPLERDGEMSFDLGEEDGGTLSAFQITNISEKEIEVPADRIGVLMDSEE